MECDELRQLIPLYLDGEMGVEDEAEFLEHVHQCRACAQVFEPEQRFHLMVRRRLRPPPAPDDLRRDIMLAMHRDRRPRALRVSAAAGLVAAAAAAVALFVWSPWGNVPIPGTIQAAMARQGDDSLPLDVATNKPEELRKFFGRRLPFELALPRLKAKTYKVRGGRMTYLRESPTAVIRYEINGAAASLYVFRDAPTTSFITSQGRYRIIQGQRRRAVVWEQGGVVYSLVGEVPAAALFELAEELK